MNTNIKTGTDATESLIKGAKLAIEAIKPTYGPSGINGVVERDIPPFAEVANDAQTLVQAMHTDDPYEKIGLGLIKELMNRADASSGDGRKTTAIIAGAILDKAIENGVSGMELKRELDALIPLVEAKIDAQKRLITENDVEAVATVASESPRIGKLLGDIYKNIGKDGIIHVEGSGTYEDDVKYIEGVRFMGTGFLSPFMVHDEEAVKDGRKETRAVYEKPIILVTKRKIGHINDINPLLQTLQSAGKKDLVIFTDDMDSNVASLLVKLHQDKLFNVLIIKAPTLWKNFVFEDFAKITGATIVEDVSGINFKNLALSHLGMCGKIIVDKEETTVVGIADITSHLEELQKNGDNDSKLRLSWLQTKTAILKLGANSESELSYLRLKTHDAVNSSRLALKDGVVPGAGWALRMSGDGLPDTIAGNILKDSLRVPMDIIGIAEVSKVVDASLVVKNAVRNAVSLASTILTLGVVIVTPQPTEKELIMMQLATKRPY